MYIKKSSLSLSLGCRRRASSSEASNKSLLSFGYMLILCSNDLGFRVSMMMEKFLQKKKAKKKKGEKKRSSSFKSSFFS